MKESSTDIARRFVDACNTYGWNYEVRGNGVLTITKNITPNDTASFCDADMEYDSILSHVPRTSAGSTWGTDGGGMGGVHAMSTGLFKMNMSGGSKRVLGAISKLR